MVNEKSSTHVLGSFHIKGTLLFTTCGILALFCLVELQAGHKATRSIMAASQSPCKLPIVDLKKDNLKPGTSSWTATCDSVRHALEEYGCFLVVQDHVCAQFEKEVFDVVRELFDLPTESKSQYNLDMFVGYVGQLPHAPLHESMEIPKATTIDGVQAFTDLMWPSGNKRFCETMLTYAKLVAEVEQTVDKMVFASYGTMDHLESHIESSTYILRPLKYTPPEMHNNVDVGADVHTDKGFITMLHQNQVNALKVQARNGEWIDVDFSPASFLVLAGDAYQVVIFFIFLFLVSFPFFSRRY